MLYKQKIYLHALLYTLLITLFSYWFKATDRLVYISGVHPKLHITNNVISIEHSGYKNRTLYSGNDFVPKIVYQPEQQKNDRRRFNETKVENERKGLDKIVKDGIYWSDKLESALPKGITSELEHKFFTEITSTRIAYILKPRKYKCSNSTPNNRYIVLENNVAMCARVSVRCWDCREGELLTYHLSRLLGMDNVPPVKYVIYNASTGIFHHFAKVSGWDQGENLTMSLFINELKPGIPLPEVILWKLNNSRTLTSNDEILQNMSKPELLHLMQLSDLIVLDFLVLHGDRILRNKLQSEKPTKWFHKNQESNHGHLYMTSPIKNLLMGKQNDKFWLLDNDLSFKSNSKEISECVVFNEHMLKTICIFRKSTVINLKKLSHSGDIFETIYGRIKKTDFLFWSQIEMRKNLKRQKIRMKKLKEKVELNFVKMLSWIEHCESVSRNFHNQPSRQQAE